MWDFLVPNIALWPRGLNPISPGTPSSACVDSEAEISEVCLLGSFSPRQGAPAEDSKGSCVQSQSQFFPDLHTGLSNVDVETVPEDVYVTLGETNEIKAGFGLQGTVPGDVPED